MTFDPSDVTCRADEKLPRRVWKRISAEATSVVVEE